ncbi:MAG: MOSC domain-containing protein YiiM [Rhodothermales bacterium]|jgi:MOSC domain-containing protein YiiM
MRTEEQILTDIAASTWSDRGTVAYLVGKPAPGVHQPCEKVQVVVARGFAGDHEKKAFWKGQVIPGREVSAISIEVLRSMGLAPDVSGDNLVTRGIDLSALQEGDRLVMGPVTLVRGPKTHRPCALFRQRAGAAAFAVAAAGHRGALFFVARGGPLSINDQIRVERA